MMHCQGVEKQLGKFTLNGLINICLCREFTNHQNSVWMSAVLWLKWFSRKKCGALIGSSFWRSQNPVSTFLYSHFVTYFRWLRSLILFTSFRSRFISDPKIFSGAYKQRECEASDPRIALHRINPRSIHLLFVLRFFFSCHLVEYQF